MPPSANKNQNSNGYRNATGARWKNLGTTVVILDHQWFICDFHKIHQDSMSVRCQSNSGFSQPNTSRVDFHRKKTSVFPRFEWLETVLELMVVLLTELLLMEVLLIELRLPEAKTWSNLKPKIPRFAELKKLNRPNALPSCDQVLCPAAITLPSCFCQSPGEKCFHPGLLSFLLALPDSSAQIRSPFPRISKEESAWALRGIRRVHSFWWTLRQLFLFLLETFWNILRWKAVCFRLLGVRLVLWFTFASLTCSGKNQQSWPKHLPLDFLIQPLLGGGC